ncbi:MAG: response regulator [Desulfonatronovibrionaceae bacterium]
MRVLIVEDDMTSRMVLSKILSNQFECDTAENGLEAVDKFKQALKDNNPYQLILLDIMMPVMDGQSALMAIREIEARENIPEGQEIRAIMTTALTDPGNVTEAFTSGQADAYITKPFSRNKIMEALQEVKVIP